MSSSSSLAVESRSKRTIKRKIDDSVLKKARAALGLPLENDDNEGEGNAEPSLKWKKPRHNTAEGQIYVKNKERRKKLEMDASNQSTLPTSRHNKKDDKTKSKKKRKKKKSKSGNVESSDVCKNPESEKRHRMEALSYLQLWASNRDHWKFEKLKQTWLLKNCLSVDLIDDKCFEKLIEYASSIKGAAKKSTLIEMQTVVTKFEASSDPPHQQAEQQLPLPPTTTKEMYGRARQLVQMLEDD